MKRIVLFTICLVIGLFSLPAISAQLYGNRFCDDFRFNCERVSSGESWESMFPNEKKRDVVQKLNRMNTPLYPGMVIAVPKDINYLNTMDVSPFQAYIHPTGEKTVIVDQKRLAWGAYNAEGQLLNWGPVSTGRAWCSDIGSGCHTQVGSFYISSKRGEGCVSSLFPIGEGGAPMPYCMFFHGGQALHGSYEVPGYRASHGCVRMFIEDARWLNEFFTPGGKTKVVVEPI